MDAMPHVASLNTVWGKGSLDADQLEKFDKFTRGAVTNISDTLERGGVQGAELQTLRQQLRDLHAVATSLAPQVPPAPPDERKFNTYQETYGVAGTPYGASTVLGTRVEYYNTTAHPWAEADAIGDSVKGMQSATDQLTKLVEEVVAAGKPLSEAQLQVGSHTEKREIGSHPEFFKTGLFHKEIREAPDYAEVPVPDMAPAGPVVGDLLDQVSRYAHQFYTLGSQVNQQGLTPTDVHYLDSVSGTVQRNTLNNTVNTLPKGATLANRSDLTWKRTQDPNPPTPASK
ncbi:MAG: hypothetical protein ACYCW6_26990 [Candidatus Xenobia bacterium]